MTTQPIPRHCEPKRNLGEAIQSVARWIAASPAAPRNDEFFAEAAE